MSELINNLEVKRIKLISGTTEIDLINMFVSINIYEDLFSNFLTGKIMFLDTGDLQNELPIVGGETIELMFSSPWDNDKQQMTFKVYNLKGNSKTFSNVENRKTEVIYFCSPEMIEDEKIKISKKFSGDSKDLTSSIVTKAYKSNKTLNCESKTGFVDVVSNFWNPSKTIEYFCSHQDNIFDFIFFENRNGFNFESLNTLMSKPIENEFIMEDGQESLFGKNNILQFKINKYFNLIETLKSGSMGNTVQNLDKNYYSNKINSTDISEITKYIVSLGGSTIFNNDYINNNSTTFSYNNNRNKRIQLLKMFMNYHLILKMPGDTTKTIGQVCKINFKSMMKEKLEYNNLLSGSWLITNINHEILKGGKYFQNIKVIKNSLMQYDKHNNILGRKN